MMKFSTSMDMLNGSLADKLLIFSLPLMLSSILQLLFNAADIVVVGRYVGKQALAAVGSNTPLINLCIAIFVGLAVGTNVVVARNLGAKNFTSVSRCVHGSILLAGVGGLALGVIGSLASRQLLVLMCSPYDVIDLGTQYLRVYFLGMPGLTLYNFGSAILRAKGDTRRPLYYLTFAGIINVILNLIFVLFLQLSVVGVALATIISQYISAGLVIRCLIQEEEPLRLDLKQLRLDWYIAESILSIGLPAGLQSAVFAISNVIIQSTVNSFNSDVMSGAAAAASIETFIYMSMNAFHQAALTFIGQNFGAKKADRIDRITALCIAYVVVIGLVMGNLAYWNGHMLLGIYIPGEASAIEAGMLRLARIGRTCMLCGFMDLMVAVLRGLGKSVMPMIAALVGACGLRIAWVYWVFPLDPTPATLFLSYPITWGITGLTLLIMFFVARKPIYASFEESSPIALQK